MCTRRITRYSYTKCTHRESVEGQKEICPIRLPWALKNGVNVGLVEDLAGCVDQFRTKDENVDDKCDACKAQDVAAARAAAAAAAAAAAQGPQA